MENNSRKEEKEKVNWRNSEAAKQVRAEVASWPEWKKEAARIRFSLPNPKPKAISLGRNCTISRIDYPDYTQ